MGHLSTIRATLLSILGSDVSGLPAYIDAFHHKIHEGKAFFYNDSITLGAAGTQQYMLTTPSAGDYVHLAFSVIGSGSTSIQLFESGDRTGTTPQTVFNRKRTSTNTADSVVHKGTSGGTTNGTSLFAATAGGKFSAGAVNRAHELTLIPDTKYLFLVTSNDAGNDIIFDIDWYETA